MHGRGHLFGGLLPTPETGRAFGVLLQEAQATVTNYTAPAPSNRGTILAISLLIGLTAVAVDAIGVTYRSPALAGIPLLSAFLASATNSGDGLGAWYAVPGRPRLARAGGAAGGALAAGLGHGIPALVVRPARRPDHGVRDARPGGRRRRPRRGHRAARADPALPHDVPRRRAGPQRQRPRRVRLERPAGLEHRHRPRPRQPVDRPGVPLPQHVRPARAAAGQHPRHLPPREVAGELRLHLRAGRRPDPRADRRARGAAPGRADLGGRQQRSACPRSRCPRARSAPRSRPARGT